MYRMFYTSKVIVHLAGQRGILIRLQNDYTYTSDYNSDTKIATENFFFDCGLKANFFGHTQSHTILKIFGAIKFT